jgi:voltage-gated potassium channel
VPDPDTPQDGARRPAAPKGPALPGRAGPDDPAAAGRQLDDERLALLQQLAAALERPMAVLGVVWLALVVVELTAGLSPFLTAVNYAIWGLFVVQFALEFALAPRKLTYLRRNWLSAVSLLLPALRAVRLVRALRVLRAARGARLVRVVSSANRGMRTLGRVMGRRGLGYVVALTTLVNVLGAAGIYAFERDVAGGAIPSFGVALWWTAMTLTTMGADYFPRSAEGRLLGLLLAIYGFAVFGYVTASIASLFVARDAEADDGELAGAPQLEALRADVAALTRRVDELLAAQERTR